jgi:hypothetical protein
MKNRSTELGQVAAITWQRPLFIEPLLSNGYCLAAYFAVVA